MMRFASFSPSRPTRLAPWGRLVVALLLLVVAAMPIHAQEGAKQDVQPQIERIVDRFGTGDLRLAWQGGRELETIGEEVIPWARDAVGSGPPAVRLMAAKVLISLGSPDDSERPLRELAADTELDTPLRVAALDLLSNFATPTASRLFRKILSSDEGYDPALRITAARALFYSSTEDRYLARSSLVPLLDVEDPAVRGQAAIALGEMGLTDGRVRSILQSIEDEPTPEGLQARLILANDLLMKRLERQPLVRGGDAVGDGSLKEQLDKKDAELEQLRETLSRQQQEVQPLINDVLERIEALYADPSRVDRKDLIIAAAKGMVASLDPFSSFMDAEDTREFYEGISGEYAGIGAQVAKDADTDYMEILRPIYKGPAYRMGLRTYDKITEVEGISTQGLRLDEIVKRLKGNPGKKVEVKVFRRGWREPRNYAIERELIHVDSVLADLLPGQIGYLRLTQFGDSAVQEFRENAKRLEEQGMKGLILDLRNNPGGYLTAAVDLVDYFVDDTDRPIVSQRGPSPSFPPKEHFAEAGNSVDYPLVVLVNRASASASEIVSGALQDFERATLVGERTFGKGSVQQLLPLPESTNQELGGDTTLRLTVQHYYLPSGRSIHTRRDRDRRILEKGGVAPDIEIEPETIPLWRAEATSLLQDDDVFEEYLDKHYAAHEELLGRIARSGDLGDTSVYPDFAEFFTPRNRYHAEPDDIRYSLRAMLRRKVEDERGSQFACDFPEDIQLQRAILTLMKKLDAPAEEVPEYRFFARKFDEKSKGG